MGFLILLFFSGRREKRVLIQKSEKFIEYFNQSDSKSVHKMFSVEMKQAPLINWKKSYLNFQGNRSYNGKGVCKIREYLWDFQNRSS